MTSDLFFNKSLKPLTEATLNIPENDTVCLVAGVKSGKWQLYRDGVLEDTLESKAGDGILSFNAKMGKITLKLS